MLVMTFSSFLDGALVFCYSCDFFAISVVLTIFVAMKGDQRRSIVFLIVETVK